MKKYIAFFCLFFIFGCTTTDVKVYKPIDFNNKVVATSNSLGDFAQELKDVLRNEGYEVLIGSDFKDSAYKQKKARYELQFKSWKEDVCIFPPSPLISYGVLFVDLKEGDEVFSMKGYDCQKKVIDKFKEIISGQYIQE